MPSQATLYMLIGLILRHGRHFSLKQSKINKRYEWNVEDETVCKMSKQGKKSTFFIINQKLNFLN